jgi:hypothetical protein
LFSAWLRSWPAIGSLPVSSQRRVMVLLLGAKKPPHKTEGRGARRSFYRTGRERQAPGVAIEKFAQAGGKAPSDFLI